MTAVARTQRPDRIGTMTDVPDLDLAGLPERLTYAVNQRRRQTGLSQNEIARICGAESGNFSAYLHGQRLKGITLATVWKIAQALGIRPEWLASGQEPSGLTNAWAPPPQPKSGTRPSPSSGRAKRLVQK